MIRGFVLGNLVLGPVVFLVGVVTMSVLFTTLGAAITLVALACWGVLNS